MKEVKETFWQEVLQSLTVGSSNFLFPREGRTRVRLGADRDGLYFLEVQTQYQGRIKTKFLLLAVPMDEGEKTWKGLIVPKTVFRSIATLAAEGYELWDPEEAHGITIVRTGSGLESSYSVLPSHKPIPLPREVREQEIPSLTELLRVYQRIQARRWGGEEEEEEESLSPVQW